MPARKVVIGIDPGFKAGIAVVTVEKFPMLLYSKSVKIRMFPKPEWFALNMCITHLDEDDEIVRIFIEDQYVGNSESGNCSKKNLIKLAQKAGRWEATAGNLEYETEWTAASSWKRKMGIGVRNNAYKVVDEHHSITLKGNKEDTINEADAICIATYGALRIYNGSTR